MGGALRAAGPQRFSGMGLRPRRPLGCLQGGARPRHWPGSCLPPARALALLAPPHTGGLRFLPLLAWGADARQHWHLSRGWLSPGAQGQLCTCAGLAADQAGRSTHSPLIVLLRSAPTIKLSCFTVGLCCFSLSTAPAPAPTVSGLPGWVGGKVPGPLPPPERQLSPDRRPREGVHRGLPSRPSRGLAHLSQPPSVSAGQWCPGTPVDSRPS